MTYRLTPKEAIEAIKCNYPPENYSILREALDMAIEALEKVEAYERFIEYFVFEGGYGDCSAMCEYMTGHNDTWCSEHCGAEKPDLNCVIKWAEDDKDEK